MSSSVSSATLTASRAVDAQVVHQLRPRIRHDDLPVARMLGLLRHQIPKVECGAPGRVADNDHVVLDSRERPTVGEERDGGERRRDAETGLGFSLVGSRIIVVSRPFSSTSVPDSSSDPRFLDCSCCRTPRRRRGLCLHSDAPALLRRSGES